MNLRNDATHLSHIVGKQISETQQDSNSSCIESASSQWISFYIYIEQFKLLIMEAPWITLVSVEYSIQKHQLTGISLWQKEEHCQKKG